MSLTVHHFLLQSIVYILLGWGMYINFRNGQLYMGPIFTMGIGAYASAYAAVEWGWPFGLAFIFALGLGALAGFVPALALGRAPAFTVAIATMGLIAISQTVIRNTDALGGIGGYYGVPRPDYLLPLSFVILIIIGFFIYRLDHSRVGRAMEAVSIDPGLASSMGVNQYWLSVFCQTCGGALGAIAGCLFAFNSGALDPVQYGFPTLLRVAAFFFVGGSGTMWGCLVFTPILWAINIFLPPDITMWRATIYGVLIIIVLLIRMEGVITKPMIRAIAVKSRAWLEQLTGLSKARNFKKT